MHSSDAGFCSPVGLRKETFQAIYILFLFIIMNE